jgi:glyoxylase-like metal-dependent hydrolase (beta-lactamase superfamily II)
MRLPVADNWYEVRGMEHGVNLIYEQHVDPGLRCNIWHVKGRDQDLLIDSGLGLVPLRDTVALLSEQPLTAVASHTHFDHIGCHSEFEQRCCHPSEAHVMQAPDAVNTVWQEYRGLMDDSPHLSALPYADFSFDQYKITPAPPTHLIDEGDELDLGNRLFKVFHMPGHSPGSICLYEASTRIIFTGDVLYDGELLDTLYHSDIDRYLETMVRLKELPAEIFHCGHYGSFGREKAHRLIDAFTATR